MFALLAVAVVILVPDFEKPGGSKTEKAAVKKAEKGVIINTLKSSSTWICIFVIMCGYALWNTVNGYMGTYGTRVLNLSQEMSSTLSIIRSYIIVFVAGVTGGIIMDKFSYKGKGMFMAFSLCGVCAAAIFLTSKMTIICVGVTIVLSYMVNVVKSTYWSIMGEAGIPLATTGMATGIISLIALTPDIYVPPVISRFIDYGESINNVELGFNLMLLWIVVWAILGVGASVILYKKGVKQKTSSRQDGGGANINVPLEGQSS